MKRLVPACQVAAIILVLCASAPPAAAQSAAAPLRAEPARVLVEDTHLGQSFNFDLRLFNTTTSEQELARIAVRARDEHGALIYAAELNENGVSPSINTLPRRTIPAGEGMTVFNPFHTFPRDPPIARLDYIVELRTPDGAMTRYELSVAPQRPPALPDLRLPLEGRLLVWDGHDFLAHHRRLDFDFPFIVQMGLNANSSRYALDLVEVDENGEMHEGDPSVLANHFIYGDPVSAPLAGRVVAVVNNVDDAAEKSIEPLLADPNALFGNYVILQVDEGVFALLGHLQMGSIEVSVGQRVRRGQRLARVGNSGLSIFPHLHFELAQGVGIQHEGLPATFTRFDYLRGLRRVRGDGTSPDTGDIIQGR